MGTRGKFGFLFRRKPYTCYSHFDSSPWGIGVNLLLETMNADLNVWMKLLENIKEVSEEVQPTLYDINKLRKYTDLDITMHGDPIEGWHGLLRYTQGSFHHVLHSGYMENVEGLDVGEEYCYQLDFDDKLFKAKGHDLDEVKISLEKGELMKYVHKWSDGEITDSKYDPEENLENYKNFVKRIILNAERLCGRF